MDAKAPSGAPRFGAYGYEVVGVEADAGLVRLPREQLPRVVLLQQEDHGPQRRGNVSSAHAVLTLPRGGQVHLDRRSREARFLVPDALPPSELVHPCLGAVASIFSHWDGRLGFHAGAFVQADRAWGVLGGNEAGKSSLLGAMAIRETPILTDDFLTLSGPQAWAGPRSIDLREGAIESLDLTGLVRPSRGGTRWRLPLGDVPPTVPLGGWFLLGWGEEVALANVSPEMRLRELPLYRPVQDSPRDLASLLDLVTLPTWRLERPSRWNVIDDIIDAITLAIRTLT